MAEPIAWRFKNREISHHWIYADEPPSLPFDLIERVYAAPVWQPIKTVPKDRSVLLWDSEAREVCAGKWHVGRRSFVATGTEESLAWIKPTHWQEPPAGP